MTLTRRHVLRAAGTLPLLGMQAAQAQQYPSKPIKIIVGASAGVGIDLVARHFTEPLSKRLNTPVVIENRLGAGGALAYAATARAPADGYTIMIAGIPLYLIPLLSEASAGFDPVKEFVPIARVGRVPLMVVVGADSPYRALPELIQAMRERPGALTYSTLGQGSSSGLCSVLLNDISKTKAESIGYKEQGMLLTDVASGRVAFTCQGIGGVLPMIEGGRLRALAITGATRLEALKNVPAAAESLSGFELSSWYDFIAPAATPPEIVQLLSTEILRIAQTPQFSEFATKQMMSLDIVGSGQLLREVPVEAAKWKRLAQLTRGK